MDWFRMYSEFATDPKVQSMTEAMQRRLTMLLCLRCSNTLVTLQDDEIAFALRIDDADLAETKAVFLRKGFINDAWELENWDKRQFISDSSAPRVAKHRAAKKAAEKSQETGDETQGNVAVTAQNRTDTEQKNTPIPPSGGIASKKKSAIALQTYLDNCKAETKKPIPEGDSVFVYATKAGISQEFLRLQWLEFKGRYTEPGAKRYKDWATVFRKSVRGNWFRLWFASGDGGYSLTTQGVQAQQLHEGKS